MNALRVYCAGPLFNQSERTEMTAMADLLVTAGYDVYLPHRDGMEFRLVLDVLVERGWERAAAAQFLHEAIFALDVYQVAIGCGAMVWNLNGRTPDEGAVSEAAIAWTLGKPIVAYHDDARSLIAGRMNPLLAGLVDFETVSNMTDIVPRLAVKIREHTHRTPHVESLPRGLQTACNDGAALWAAMQRADAYCQNEILADCVTELFAPQPSSPLATSQSAR